MKLVLSFVLLAAFMATSVASEDRMKIKLAPPAPVDGSDEDFSMEAGHRAIRKRNAPGARPTTHAVEKSSSPEEADEEPLFKPKVRRETMVRVASDEFSASTEERLKLKKGSSGKRRAHARISSAEHEGLRPVELPPRAKKPKKLPKEVSGETMSTAGAEPFHSTTFKVDEEMKEMTKMMKKTTEKLGGEELMMTTSETPHPPLWRFVMQPMKPMLKGRDEKRETEGKLEEPKEKREMKKDRRLEAAEREKMLLPKPVLEVEEEKKPAKKILFLEPSSMMTTFGPEFLASSTPFLLLKEEHKVEEKKPEKKEERKEEVLLLKKPLVEESKLEEKKPLVKEEGKKEEKTPVDLKKTDLMFVGTTLMPTSELPKRNHAGEIGRQLMMTSTMAPFVPSTFASHESDKREIRKLVLRAHRQLSALMRSIN